MIRKDQQLFKEAEQNFTNQIVNNEKTPNTPFHADHHRYKKEQTLQYIQIWEHDLMLKKNI